MESSSFSVPKVMYYSPAIEISPEYLLIEKLYGKTLLPNGHMLYGGDVPDPFYARRDTQKAKWIDKGVEAVIKEGKLAYLNMSEEAYESMQREKKPYVAAPDEVWGQVVLCGENGPHQLRNAMGRHKPCYVLYKADSLTRFYYETYLDPKRDFGSGSTYYLLRAENVRAYTYIYTEPPYDKLLTDKTYGGEGHTGE